MLKSKRSEQDGATSQNHGKFSEVAAGLGPGVARTTTSGATSGTSATKSSPVTEVVFCTYPKLVFTWPVIVVGYLFFFPSMIWSDAQALSHFLGWAYVMVLGTVILTMGIDLDRNLSVFWLVVVVAILLCALLLNTKEIPVFEQVWHAAGAADVKYNHGLGLALSLVLTPPYIVMLIWSRMNHRWRMTHNEFEQYAWGRADDSLARGAKRVRSTYPDWLEFALLGAGTLIVYSATGRQELRRIRHVPMLFRVRKKINLLLESQQVSLRDDTVMADELEAEEEASPAAEQAEGGISRAEGGVEGSEKDPL